MASYNDDQADASETSKMAPPKSPFQDLPTELHSAILSELRTDDLLTAVEVSRRFYSLGVLILRRRILETSSLPDNQVVLECYHPSAKISTPYLSCRFLGTAICEDPGQPVPAIDEEALTILDLRQIYSSFRPVQAQENRRRRFRYGWSVEPIGGSTHLDVAAEDPLDEVAHQDVFLDEGERFSQLCTITNIVKVGQRPGIFLRHINICDKTVRVFRHWLRDMLPTAADAAAVDDAAAGDEYTSSFPSSSTTTTAAAVSGTIADSGRFSSTDPRIIWVDDLKNIGLRFQVLPGADVRGTIFDDEPPVSYNLIYEELLIRSSLLLYAVEESNIDNLYTTGKDVIIAGF